MGWDEIWWEKKSARWSKAKNILTSDLSFDEFLHTTRWKSAKEIWKMLEVTHDGSVDVRRARKQSCIRIWSFTNEEWRNHFRNSKKIHTYCESPSRSWKNIWRWWFEHQNPQLSYKKIGTKDQSNQWIQGLGINFDRSSLRKRKGKRRKK